METNNIQTLEKIKHRIEALPKVHHIQVLKLLKKYSNIKLNENKSGIYVNLSFLPETDITILQKYIKDVDDQERMLRIAEDKKEELKELVLRAGDEK